MMGYMAFAAVASLLIGTVFALRFNVQRKSELLMVAQGMVLVVVGTIVSFLTLLGIPLLFIIR